MIKNRLYFCALVLLGVGHMVAAQPVQESFGVACKRMASNAIMSLASGSWSLAKRGSYAAANSISSIAQNAGSALVCQATQHPAVCAGLCGAVVAGRLAYSLWYDRLKIYPENSGHYSLRQVNDLLFPGGGEQRTHIYQWNRLINQTQWPQAYNQAGAAVNGALEMRHAVPADMKPSLYAELAQFCAASRGILQGELGTVAAVKRAMQAKINADVGQLQDMLAAIKVQAEGRVTVGQQFDWCFGGYGNQYKTVCNQFGGISNIADARLADQKTFEQRMRAPLSKKTRIVGWCNLFNPFVKSKLFMQTAYELCWEIQRRIDLLNALSMALTIQQDDEQQRVNVRLEVVPPAAGVAAVAAAAAGQRQ